MTGQRFVTLLPVWGDTLDEMYEAFAREAVALLGIDGDEAADLIAAASVHVTPAVHGSGSKFGHKYKAEAHLYWGSEPVET